MVKCTFCGSQIAKGTGLMFVYKDGKVVHFCSSKCKKSLLKLGRKAIHTRWTAAYKQ